MQLTWNQELYFEILKPCILINLFPFINQLHSRPTYTIVYFIITPTYFGTDVFSSGSFYIKF